MNWLKRLLDHPLPALLAALALAAAAGCVAPGARAAAEAGGVVAVQVAPGVYLMRGSGGEPDAENLGRVGNAGFIVGEAGVVAIDTGTSHRHGTELLAAIRRVTDKPVRLAFVTHARQEFLFGAAAYRERGVPIAMHAKAATLMASRCETCLKNLRKLLGEEAMRGTAMFTPDRTFDASHRDETLTDRPLQVLHFGHSSGPGDIAVFDARSGVLFAGGLLEAGRIPDVIDSDLPEWRAALQALRRLPVKRVVPGHGDAADAARAIDDVERYLAQLEARVRALMQADTPLSQIAEAASLPEFEAWDQYDNTHRRNASIVFLRLERESLFKTGS
jgi:glyoxylase-like metal-dependent hydrolase (beta-lactamase superfamily II)